MQDNGLIQRLAEDAMGKKGAPNYPYILCKRNVPPDLTYDLHAVGEWEGLKRTLVDGRIGYEIDMNFTLVIKPDGACFIPDTPNNQLKLNRLGKKQVHEELKKRHNSILGIDEEYTVRTVIPPFYERVEANLLSGALTQDLADKVMAEIARRQAEAGVEEAEEVEIRPHHAANGTVSTEVPTPKGGKKGAAMAQPGDPPKRAGRQKPDLLAPVR